MASEFWRLESKIKTWTRLRQKMFCCFAEHHSCKGKSVAGWIWGFSAQHSWCLDIHKQRNQFTLCGLAFPSLAAACWTVGSRRNSSYSNLWDLIWKRTLQMEIGIWDVIALDYPSGREGGTAHDKCQGWGRRAVGPTDSEDRRITEGWGGSRPRKPRNIWASGRALSRASSWLPQRWPLFYMGTCGGNRFGLEPLVLEPVFCWGLGNSPWKLSLEYLNNHCPGQRLGSSRSIRHKFLTEASQRLDRCPPQPGLYWLKQDVAFHSGKCRLL